MTLNAYPGLCWITLKEAGVWPMTCYTQVWHVPVSRIGLSSLVLCLAGCVCKCDCAHVRRSGVHLCVPAGADFEL
jgi:hypothetical protein